MTRDLGPLLAARLLRRPLLIDPFEAQLMLAGMVAEGLLPPLLWNEGAGARFLPAARPAPEAGPGVGHAGRDRDGGESELYRLDRETGIATIPIEGPLSHKRGMITWRLAQIGYDAIAVQLRAAVADPAVKGILLDEHSPGGAGAGLFDLVALIHELRDAKPIWAVAYDDALSAAYAIASAANVLVGTRSSSTGSVGAWFLHVDCSGMLEQEGIVATPVFAGARKVDGHPYAKLPAEVRARWEVELEDTREVFIDWVARGRAVSAEAVRNTEGQSLLAPEALDLGLIDEIATFDETYQEFARQLAKAPAMIAVG